MPGSNVYCTRTPPPPPTKKKKKKKKKKTQRIQIGSKLGPSGYKSHTLPLSLAGPLESLSYDLSLFYTICFALDILKTALFRINFSTENTMSSASSTYMQVFTGSALKIEKQEHCMRMQHSAVLCLIEDKKNQSHKSGIILKKKKCI